MNNFSPSQDQWIAQLRMLIPVIGALISSFGWVSADQIGPIVSNLLIALGPVVYVISSIWSLVANSRASIMKSASKPVIKGEESPQIQLPFSEKKLADSLPSNVTTQAQ